MPLNKNFSSMRMCHSCLLIFGVVLWIVSPQYSWGITAEQAKRLGESLTPIGAERAGSEDGIIPEWTGGLPVNKDTQRGKFYKNPFANEIPLFVITKDNLNEHLGILLPGHIALLEKNPDFRMPVYKTHRSCAFPQKIYDMTVKNAQEMTLTEDGNSISGKIGGYPFPIPQNGVEVLWNHLLRYNGFKVTRESMIGLPSYGGWVASKLREDWLYFWYDPKKSTTQDVQSLIISQLTRVLQPARMAGTLYLIKDALNPLKNKRKAWLYSPGDRRIRSAPEASYDYAEPSLLGLITIDAFNGFNGSPDRYNWRLVGKVNRLIAYNNYDARNTPLRDFLQPRAVRWQDMRYEVHRLWVVEGTVKPGKRHLYPKRVMYFDEDTWRFAFSEIYDGRGNLWRVQEHLIMNFYDFPVCSNIGEITYDLISGRYAGLGLLNGTSGYNFDAKKLTENSFRASRLKRLGVR